MKIFGYEIKKIPRSQSVKFFKPETNVDIGIDIGNSFIGEIDNIFSKFAVVEREFPDKFTLIDKAKLLKIFCESEIYHVEIV